MLCLESFLCLQVELYSFKLKNNISKIKVETFSKGLPNEPVKILREKVSVTHNDDYVFMLQ